MRIRPRLSAAMTALAGVLVIAPAAAAPPTGYQIALPAELALDVGQAGAASLTIAPEPGYTISRTGPLRVALAAEPEAGLELPRRRYQRSHAADRLAEAPRFDLAVRGASAGRYRLTVDILFWLCRGRSCRPVRVARAVDVEVRAAPPPPSPGSLVPPDDFSAYR
jgi:hypothetical protein